MARKSAPRKLLTGRGSLAIARACFEALEGRTYFGGFNQGTPATPDCGCGTDEANSATNEPVIYQSGTPQLTSTDLQSNAFGKSWGLTRNWIDANVAGTNPNGWTINDLPFLSIAKNDFGHIGIVRVNRSANEGTEDFQGYGNSYTPFGKNLDTLTLVGGSSYNPAKFKLTDRDGNTWMFYDLPRASGGTINANAGYTGAITQQYYTGTGSVSGTPTTSKYQFGAFASYTDASGNYTVTANYDGSTGDLTEVVRTDGSSYERLHYNYKQLQYTYTDPNTSSNDFTTTMRVIDDVSLQRRASTSDGWKTVRTARYDYYDGSDGNGRLGDLKLVTISQPAKAVGEIDSIVASGSTDATVTFAAAHGYSNGDLISIDGASTKEFNGTFKVSSASGTTLHITLETAKTATSTDASLPINGHSHTTVDNKYYRYYKFHTRDLYDGTATGGITYTAQIPDKDRIATLTFGMSTYYVDKAGGTNTTFARSGGTGGRRADNTVVSGIRAVVEGVNYARMAANSAINASDISGYANNIFTYERYYSDETTHYTSGTEIDFAVSKYRVVQEIAAGSGCSSCSGGFGTSQLSFAVNPHHKADLIDNVSGILTNSWSIKTKEYLPDTTSGTWADNNYNLVYTNEVGKVLLKVIVDTNGTTTTSDDTATPTAYRYDQDGRLIFIARPSALAKFDVATVSTWETITDSNGEYDLVGWGAGTTKVRSASGRIEHHSYYGSTTANDTLAGGASGYEESYAIRQGYSGSDVLISSQDYIAHTPYSGAVMYLVANQSQYWDVDQDSDDDEVTTSYTYSWALDGSSHVTNRMASRTVTKEAVHSTRNGSGSDLATSTVFDSIGRPIWTKDEAGYINYTEYNSSGAVIKSIVDVDTSQTSNFTGSAPWSSSGLPGTRLNLTTLRESDEKGRTTKLVDPKGNVTYTVYNDENYEWRRYSGWTGTAKTGPIEIHREYRPLAGASLGQQTAYSEVIFSSATANYSSGRPTGTETINESNIVSLSRSITNDAGQMVEQDRYFKLGVSYSVANAHLGSASDNSGESGKDYHATFLDYDANGQVKRQVSSSGTITRMFFDARGNATSTWVGTDDAPNSGFFSPSNTAGTNMVLVSENQYDIEGNLLRTTSYPGGGASPRTTAMLYDWRDRMIVKKEGMQANESDTGTNRPLTRYTYDNAGHVIKVDQYDGDQVGISASAPTFDNSDFLLPAVPSGFHQPTPFSPWIFNGGAGFSSGSATLPDGGSAEQVVHGDFGDGSNGIYYYLEIVSDQISSGATLKVYAGTTEQAGSIGGLPLIDSFSPSGSLVATVGFNPEDTEDYQIIKVVADGGDGVNIASIRLWSIDEISLTPVAFPVIWDEDFQNPATWTGAGDHSVEGEQTLLLDSGGSITQTKTFGSTGDYYVSFDADIAPSTPSAINVYLAGTLVDTIPVYTSSNKRYSSIPFHVTSGSRAVKFEVASGGATVSLDNVSIAPYLVDTTPTVTLLQASTEYAYDELGRNWATYVFDVGGSDSLVTKNWFDARGNTIKTVQPGGITTKNAYDGAGRVMATHQTSGDGSGDSIYGNADDVTDDVVLEQTEYTYDANGNVTFTATRQRADNATLTGDLADEIRPAQVTGRYVFYNNSVLDGFDMSSDDSAIDTSLTALLPGGTNPSSAISSYAKGINGIFIDVANLPASSLSSSDFTFKVGNDNSFGSWTTVSATPTITIRPGEGGGGTDRIVVTWADNEIQNTWLQVTLKAGANTGLANEDTFYFGNLIADTDRDGEVTSDDLVAMHGSYNDQLEVDGQVSTGYAESASFSVYEGAAYSAGASEVIREDYGGSGLIGSSDSVEWYHADLYFLPGSATGSLSSMGGGSGWSSWKFWVGNNGYALYDVSAEGVLTRSGVNGPAEGDITGDGNIDAYDTSAYETSVSNTATLTLIEPDQFIPNDRTIRSYYSEQYYDAANRVTDSVNLGNNGGFDLLGPDASVPARSNTVLRTSYTYGDNGMVSSITDPGGKESRTYYDMLGRTAKTIANYVDGEVDTDDSKQDDDQTTEYTYNGTGQILTMKAILPGSNVFQETKYIYGVTQSGGSGVNSNDILAAVQYPHKSTGAASSGEQESFRANALGQRIRYTDRNGSIHQYTHNVLGRLTADAVTTLGSGVDGAVRRIEYSYDGLGKPRQITSYNASSSGSIVNQIQRAYNGVGQLITEWQDHTSSGVNVSTSPKVQYGYSTIDSNNRSRLEHIIYPNLRQINYTYASGLDSDISRLSAIVEDTGGAPLEEYTYLGLGTVVQRAHPESGVDLTYIRQSGEGFTDAGDQYIGMDRFGRLIDQRWIKSGTDLDRYKYSYDRNGNVLGKDNDLHPALDEEYTYDGLDRLTELDGATDKTWDLDALGNWDEVTGESDERTHNRQNQIETVNPSGTPKTLAYDDNGNMTTNEAGYTLKYDAWNRLVEVKNGGSTLAAYAYDGAGRRVQQGTIHLYYSDQWQVLEERNGSNAVTTQYVWSPVYVDAMILRDRDGNNDGDVLDASGDDRLYVMHDANFNVTGLVDNDGVVVERYQYDPYGAATILDANWSSDSDQISDVNWIYLHQGGRYDSAVNLYSFRCRDYDPTLGRWIQMDPAGYVDGANLFQYVLSTPVNRTDHLGLDSEKFERSYFEMFYYLDGINSLYRWGMEGNSPWFPDPQSVKLGGTFVWSCAVGKENARVVLTPGLSGEITKSNATFGIGRTVTFSVTTADLSNWVIQEDGLRKYVIDLHVYVWKGDGSAVDASALNPKLKTSAEATKLKMIDEIVFRKECECQPNK